MLFPALRVAGRFNDRRAGFVSSAADVQAGNSQAFQIAGDMDAFLLRQPVRDIFIAVHPDRNRESGTACKLDSLDDLRNKPHTVEEVPAIFIRTLVGVRR